MQCRWLRNLCLAGTVTVSSPLPLLTLWLSLAIDISRSPEKASQFAEKATEFSNVRRRLDCYSFLYKRPFWLFNECRPTNCFNAPQEKVTFRIILLAESSYLNLESADHHFLDFIIQKALYQLLRKSLVIFMILSLNLLNILNFLALKLIFFTWYNAILFETILTKAVLDENPVSIGFYNPKSNWCGISCVHWIYCSHCWRSHGMTIVG